VRRDPEPANSLQRDRVQQQLSKPLQARIKRGALRPAPPVSQPCRSFEVELHRREEIGQLTGDLGNDANGQRAAIHEKYHEVFSVEKILDKHFALGQNPQKGVGGGVRGAARRKWPTTCELGFRLTDTPLERADAAVQLESGAADTRFARAFHLVQHRRKPAAQILPAPHLLVVASIGPSRELVEQPSGAEAIGYPQCASPIGRSVSLEKRSQEVEIQLAPHRQKRLPVRGGAKATVDGVGMPCCGQEMPDAPAPADATEHVVRQHPGPRREIARRQDFL
jgi:hypothetical protein